MVKYISALFLLLVPYIVNSAIGEPVMSRTIAYQAADSIENHYVLPAVAVQAAERLRKKVSLGEYDDYQHDDLAKKLSEDIQAITGDGHMYVEYVDEAQQGNWIADWLAEAPAVNYGLKESAVLNDNIGYLKITTFYSLDIALNAYESAFHNLQDTNGLILDLRHNGGGDESSANALIATFLSKDAQSPLILEERIASSDEVKTTSMTLPKTLAWARYEAPLVILVNTRTFSAPESVAFALQEVGRAQALGTKTAGGAHMTDDSIKLSGRFEMGVPNKRPIGRLSGKNWERTGVLPSNNPGDSELVRQALNLLLTD